MSPIYRMRPLGYRAIWISNVHLGSRECKIDFLLDFLKSTESEHLYLVGDITDLWSIRKRGPFWLQEHSNAIRAVLEKAKNGTKVVYVPGNHDEPLRDYDQMIFGNVEVRAEYVHTTADGRRLLLMHGDQFDSVIKCGRLTKYFGPRAYDLLLCVNRLVNHLRRRLGFPYWSLAADLKHRVRNAVRHIRTFEQAVAHEASGRGVDGLVCGHIHHAEMTELDGTLYCNDGDWVTCACASPCRSVSPTASCAGSTRRPSVPWWLTNRCAGSCAGTDFAVSCCGRAAWTPSFSNPGTRRPWTPPGPSACTWAGSPWKRTSRRSWPWICRAPSTWQATAPTWTRCAPNTPPSASPDFATARSWLAAADMFVFPSRTDTFGLVLLEAMLCRVPVAAYPVTGPIDVVDDGVTGVLDEDLRQAVLKALELDGAAARAYALAHSWRECTWEFLDNLACRASSGAQPTAATCPPERRQTHRRL